MPAFGFPIGVQPPIGHASVRERNSGLWLGESGQCPTHVLPTSYKITPDKSNSALFSNPIYADLLECPRGDLNPLDHPLEAHQTRGVQRFGKFTAVFSGHRGTPRGSQGTTGRTCPTRLRHRERGTGWVGCRTPRRNADDRGDCQWRSTSSPDAVVSGYLSQTAMSFHSSTRREPHLRLTPQMRTDNSPMSSRPMTRSTMCWDGALRTRPESDL
jgi:hypothetical protein